MKNFKKAQGLVEAAIIGVVVIVIAIVAFPSLGQRISDMISNLVPKNNSVVSKAEAPAVNIQAPQKSAVDDLLDDFAKKLAALKSNNEDINSRIETTGVLGKILALYNSTSDPAQKEALKNSFLKSLDELAKADNVTLSQTQKNACLTSPSSCSELMTISDFSWKAVNNESYLNSTIAKNLDDPLPLSLTYGVSYVSDDGAILVKQIVQSVYLQKEQYEFSSQTLSAFLNSYMPTTFASNKFTGSGAQAEAQISSFLTGKNCVLSKSKSQNLDLTP